MRASQVVAVTATAALLTAGLTTGSAASPGSSAKSGVASSPAVATGDNVETNYVVLTAEGGNVDAVASSLSAGGAKVTSVNTAIGMVTVTSADRGFAARARSVAGVTGVAADRAVGDAPKHVSKPNEVEREAIADATANRGGKKGVKPKGKPVGRDNLDGYLWGHEMVKAFEARRITAGDRRVTVGILDTGIQADHIDLASKVDVGKSRNFTTDIPALDGPCEVASCVDPATVDDNEHGTHVAGTIGAALNGVGISGIAPEVTLVNIRGGQDSGYFFLGPVVNALTYAGDIGLDVVNMSFYVDPWLYNCLGGAPEDGPEAASDQKVVIEAMTRALNYAHRKNVTLVGSLGNDHDNLAKPRPDGSSPDYDNPANAWDDQPYTRTIDNSKCFDLPVEGPHVLGISALGPSGRKSDFSNHTTDLRSGEIELSAPGGWFRDGFGTDSYRTPTNLILSSVPMASVIATGEVDADGNITELGKSSGVQKDCLDTPRGQKCDFYAFFQGTSMAAPHASGVAALAVSAHGWRDRGDRGLTLAPASVRGILMLTATDHACPAGGVQTYTDEGRDASYTATCVGTPRFNGFYGAGIVNALGAVWSGHRR